MKKEPKYVAFSTQKGGAGKTTLTVLVASYLHYVKRYSVAVVDCDFPQQSLVRMRDRDVEVASNDEYYKGLVYSQFMALGEKRAYPVLESTPAKALATAEEVISQADYDFVFFDLPGTLNNAEVVRTLINMDYIFAPISADRAVLESTLSYTTMLKDKIADQSKSNIKGLYLIWNLVDGREKSELYEVYEKVMADLDLSVLKTFLPDSKRFRREQNGYHKAVFRSTLLPADKQLIKGSNLDTLVDEMLGIMQ